MSAKKDPKTEVLSPDFDNMPPDMAESARRLWRSVDGKEAQQDQERHLSSKKGANIIQLPLWPEPVRGAPNTFLRSALFAAIQGKGRQPLKSQLLGSMQGITVKFTGWQLDQSDLDVWEQAVHEARRHPLENICHFTANGFLKAMGRCNGKAQYKWLDEAITRLVACAVEIRQDSRVFTGSLLSSCARDEATGVYKLTLDRETIKLYTSESWTGIEWEQRQTLKGKPLALWLHGFYSSHAAPFAMKVETLRELSGSANKNPRAFKQKLKQAFANLKEITGITGTIDDDLVTVDRQPSPAQAKHIVQKATNKRRKKQP